MILARVYLWLCDMRVSCVYYRTVFEIPVKNLNWDLPVNVRPSQITLLGPYPTPWVLPAVYLCLLCWITFLPSLFILILLWSHFYKPIKLLFSEFWWLLSIPLWKLTFKLFYPFPLPIQIIPFFFFLLCRNTWTSLYKIFCNPLQILLDGLLAKITGSAIAGTFSVLSHVAN